MNRSLTALFAALEAVLVVGVGILIPLVPLTVVWATQYGFATDWSVFWRASADTWLLGHGVDLAATLDTALATSLGMSQHVAFTVTIAPLGFAALTILLALRAGRRVGETEYRNLGSVVAVGTFAALSLAVTLSALYPLARPSGVQGVALPTLVFAVAFAIGLARTRRAEGDDRGSSVRDFIDDWPPAVRGLVGTALRGGAMVVALVIAIASVVATALVAVNYAQIVSLYESLHTDALGGLALTLAELAFMPNVVIWVASWLVGPGFAIGAGSSVGPLSTQLGPVPSIPLLGALPTGDFAFGFLGLLAPIVAGFLVAAVLRPRTVEHLDDVTSPTVWLAGSAVAIGFVAALALGLLALASGGAAGPERLGSVGPAALAVGLWSFVEVSIAALLGMLASRQRRA